MSLEQQVRQFSETYRLPTKGAPKLPDAKESSLLLSLVEEELEELKEAISEGNLVGLADALTDIIYVTAQQSVTLGLPVDALLREVHESNMSKLGEDGQPIYREDGKVLKGPNFREPNLLKVLKEECGL